MKKVVSGKALEEKMVDAITLLCDTVKQTLGPKGKNTIIDHSDFSPFITNDGVTIAENIASEDEITNTILTLAKESSIKTNETVGDGTTTTLVLLESIYLEGLKKIHEGYSPYILKQELDNCIKWIIENLKNESRNPNIKDIKNIASISANDDEIGSILSEAYQEVGANGIIITDGEQEETLITNFKGYFFETVVASPYFFKENNYIEYKNAKILLLDHELNYLEEISDVINEVSKRKNNLVIVAQDYDENFINEVMGILYSSDYNIILLKNPSYGTDAYNILLDLEAITKGKIIIKEEEVKSIYLGYLEEIRIGKERTQICFKANKKIEERIAKYQLINDEKKESMLQKGLIEIKVGATTTTELREKKMRYIDALCAIKSASSGVLPGGGLVYYKISEKIKANNVGEKILKKALKEPMLQIFKNASLDEDTTISKIKVNDFNLLYNVKTNEYENIKETSVFDPLEVLTNCLKNACSIAGMLLTTSSLVINEQQKNNFNNYSEL